MMTAVVTIFDTYKKRYQSIRVLSPLVNFSQIRLPCTLAVFIPEGKGICT